MATIDCNDELAFYCEECYRVIYDDCENITIDIGLTGSTEYCFKFYDKFGQTYQYLATTEVNGSFTVDTSELPDNFFNPYSGIIELQIFSDCDTATRTSFSVAYTTYRCVELQNADSVESNDNSDEPNANNYVAVTDGEVTYNVPCGDTYTCVGGNDITYNVYINNVLKSTTTQSSADDLTINIR